MPPLFINTASTQKHDVGLVFQFFAGLVFQKMKLKKKDIWGVITAYFVFNQLKYTLNVCYRLIMLRNYKKKTTRGGYNMDQMKKAIDDIKTGISVRNQTEIDSEDRVISKKSNEQGRLLPNLACFSSQNTSLCQFLALTAN